MKKLSCPTCFALCTLLAASLPAFGQAAPATPAVPVPSGPSLYHGLQLPRLGGTLRYSLSASETATFGYNGNADTVSGTGISGNVAYLSLNPAHQFTLTYSGGYLKNNSSQPSTVFQNLSLGQTLQLRRWFVSVNDTVSYLPQAASTGLSGIPGVGDVGVLPIDSVNEGVLTPYSTRVNNGLSGSVTRQLTGSTGLSASGNYGIERFLSGSGGLESDTAAGSGGLNHRIDARTSASVNVSYATSTYVGYPLSFSSQSATLGYRRQLTRKFSLNLVAGPERTSSSSQYGIGPSLSYTADVHLTYAGNPVHGTQYSGGYTRSSNAGSGVSFGARTDSYNFVASRTLTQTISGAAQVAYMTNTSLQVIAQNAFNTHSETASVQVNVALRRTLSAYGSYTALRQTISGTAPGLAALNGVSQTLGFGITYSPATLHLGHP